MGLKGGTGAPSFRAMGTLDQLYESALLQVIEIRSLNLYML